MEAGVITTLDELRRVTHAPISRSLFHTRAPALRFSEANDDELNRWQKTLNRELAACGCTSGALGVIAALVGLAIAQFAVGVDLGSGFTTVGIWVGVTLATAVVGKSLGLFRARIGRRRLYAEIQRALGPGNDRRRTG